MAIQASEKSLLKPSNLVTVAMNLLRENLSTRKLRILISVACAFISILLIYILWTPIQSHVGKIATSKPHTAEEIVHITPHQDVGDHQWVKPAGFKIIGLVFYGRARFVNILDCYLKKNLVKNGGYLDEVRFIAHTKNEEDLAWLDKLLASESGYSKLADVGSYGDIWNTYGTDHNTMYIKVDDDIVFIHDDAIPRMVYTLMNNPQAYAMTSNLVNSPVTNWLHYRTNAILPYLPDIGPAVEVTDWRASKLPRHPGAKGELAEHPPHNGHRWLPLENTSENLLKTPIAEGNAYDPFGPGWKDWRIAVQQHYSFLEHLEIGNLGVYWQGNQEGIWNMQFSRYNLNFIAIWGKDVALEKVGNDDEQEMTVEIPKRLNRPVLIDTHAVVAHYSFFTTKNDVESTDLLERYRLYANEMVCTENNQKSRM